MEDAPLADRPDRLALQVGLRIHLLASPRLVLPDGVELPLERKDAALLAILSLDGPTARPRLAALLWPATTEAQARANLRQRLFRLRRSAAQELVRDLGALQLADDVVLDLTDALQHLDSDPNDGAGELLGAHDYAADAVLEAWVTQARQRWGETRLARLAERASQLEKTGAIVAALAYAQRIASENPALEHAHRRLMRLHYLRGDRAAALLAYEHCHAAIGREIGVRPGHETVQLAALIERSGELPQATPQPRPAATLRPPRLVGRDHEWRLLAAAAAANQAALILGEPGIGKTRLLGDFAGSEHSSPVFGGRPGDAALPYALLARIVRGLEQGFGAVSTGWVRDELARIVPEFGAAPATPLAPLRLQQALTQALAAWCDSGLRLLAIDDLQFSDDATLELLLPLVGAGAQPRLGWLLAAREHELPQCVIDWLSVDAAQALQRVVLGPLDVPAVQALLTSLELPGLDAAAWAAPLARHTGGNAMFILETLIAMLEANPAAPAGNLPGLPRLPAPARVGALIERRLAQLSAPALKLARVAALAGQDFSAALAATVLQQHPLDVADAWRELEAAQVISDNAFAHDLIFEATLRSVPAAIARLMHHDIARVLQAHGGAPARLAQHWFEAGEWRPAGEAFVQAALRAQAASRHAEETGLWQRAVSCFERAGERTAAFEARRSSIDSVMASQPVSEAVALTERLLAEAQSDAERLGANLAHATAMLLANRVQEGHAAALEAGMLARQLARPWDEFEAARRCATALAQLGRANEAAALLEAFGQRVASDGSTQQRYDYWSDLGYVLVIACRKRNALQALQSAIELATQLGKHHEVVTCTTNLTGLSAQLGRPEQAHAHAERAYRLRAENEATIDIVSGASEMNLAMCEAVLGRFDAALAHFDSARGKFAGSDAVVWRTTCHTSQGFVWLMLGQTTRAAQAMQEPPPAAAPAWLHARRLVVEGRVARALGSAALPKVTLALELLDQADDPFQRLLAELDLSREVDAAQAVSICRHCRERAESLELLAIGAKARVFEIEAHLRAGDAAAAAQAAALLWPSLESCRPQDLYWPEALWITHRAFEAGGDSSAALEALQQAAHWIKHAALPHVPPAFHDAFVQRNATNHAVLARARSQ